MNRFSSRISPTRSTQPDSANPYYRPTQKLRDNAEAILRDMAYVLQLTQRVKSAILQDRELAEPTVV